MTTKTSRLRPKVESVGRRLPKNANSKTAAAKRKARGIDRQIKRWQIADGVDNAEVAKAELAK